jgi:hypothetical protein
VSAILIVWKYFNASKRNKFKHLARAGEIEARTAWMCVRFNAIRVLLNTVHAFVFLTCVWFVVLLCALVATLVLFVASGRAADQALTFVQNAEKV